MTDPIRWGILGAAKIARVQLAPAIAEAAHATLAAVATRDPAKAAPFQALTPGLRVHDSYDALLADPGIDAVYIPLPNHLHIPWTRKCLEAGKAVLCEKPIALDTAEIEGLIDLRDQTGCLAAEAVMIVHHPQWHRVRALLADGAIGRLRQVQGVFTYNNAADPGNVRNQPGMGGGGLRDIGIYPSVATRFVTGQEPHHVTARIEYEGEVDHVARVQAQFDGFDLDFYCAMRLGLRQEMVFHGEGGFIRLTAPFNAGDYGMAEVHLVRPDRSAVVEQFPAKQYKLMVEAFGAALRGDAAFPFPLEMSIGTQRMIDQAFASCPPPGG